MYTQDLEGWQSTKLLKPQKPRFMKFLPTPLIFLSSVLFIGHLKANPDQFVKLGGKITITKESDQWIKASVPFVFVTHPLLEKFKSRKPSSKEDLINIEFINNIKVRLSLCFLNEYQKKSLRTLKLPDTEFYQYYSAEVEYMTIKFDRNTKYAHFLFPATIAERDGFLSTYINTVGYVVEIMYDGIPLEISDSISFDKYREERILQKFKQQAQSNASKNEGVLLPAHIVSSNYLEGVGPVKRVKGSGY
jgi:hypothetical protein